MLNKLSRKQQIFGASELVALLLVLIYSLFFSYAKEAKAQAMEVALQVQSNFASKNEQYALQYDFLAGIATQEQIKEYKDVFAQLQKPYQ
ncbi:hypothetical protein [Psittacicella hinzii]|uniref:Uncharacterized protein n=1 Tax=Psittacicella hinzii TaxID=2028575 RepID=A0A3A1YIK5_9GAMM|nr:hypothetical protein [Psittacicella hinzii]RIY37505.1 hypothetical protein CKF58_04865 [Psittacicella hinzii]